MSISEDYWSSRSTSWLKDSYGRQAKGNAVRFQIVSDYLSELEKGDLLDVGCGAGYLVGNLLSNGWRALGVDSSDGMVLEAKKYIKSQGFNEEYISNHDATDLSNFKDNSFDVVLMTGVMPYIEKYEEAYKEVHRILKKDGVFICSNQNELFNLSTFNKYTVNFYEDNIFPLINGIDKNNLKLHLNNLLSNYDKPKFHDHLSARDNVFTFSENPLLYKQKVSLFGFEMLEDPQYFSIHILPPLVEADLSESYEFNFDLQFSLRSDWRALFFGAHFVSKLIRK